MTESGLTPFLSACIVPGEMPAALQHIADRGGGDGAVLAYSRHNVTLQVVASPGLAGFVSEYVEGDRPKDTRSHRVNPTLSEDFRLDQDDFSPREIARDPFYQEFLRPRGLGWHACALLSLSPSGDGVFLSLKRDMRRGPFTASELAAVTSEIAVMRTAVQFTQGAAAIVAATSEGFRGSGRHTLLGLDSRGEAFGIVRTLRDAAVVTLRGGTILCAEPLEQARLNAAVARARQAGRAAAMLTGRDGTRWSLRIRRWPAGPETSLAFVAALNPLDDLEEPSGDWLAMAQDLFGLSPAEARVAALVGQGLPVPAMARRLAIGTGTVRNQLKAVFAKTGAVRQTELAVLMSRL